jgi:V/A-type H+/Na+-transporting ATPase subunit B
LVLSRLMKDGMGKNATRQGPPRAANQLFASYARALEVHNLAAIIGAEELSRGDRDYLASGKASENGLPASATLR